MFPEIGVALVSGEAVAEHGLTPPLPSPRKTHTHSRSIPNTSQDRRSAELERAADTAEFDRLVWG